MATPNVVWTYGNTFSRAAVTSSTLITLFNGPPGLVLDGTGVIFWAFSFTASPGKSGNYAPTSTAWTTVLSAPDFSASENFVGGFGSPHIRQGSNPLGNCGSFSGGPLSFSSSQVELVPQTPFTGTPIIHCSFTFTLNVVGSTHASVSFTYLWYNASGTLIGSATTGFVSPGGVMTLNGVIPPTGTAQVRVVANRGVTGQTDTASATVTGYCTIGELDRAVCIGGGPLANFIPQGSLGFSLFMVLSYPYPQDIQGVVTAFLTDAVQGGDNTEQIVFVPQGIGDTSDWPLTSPISESFTSFHVSSVDTGGRVATAIGTGLAGIAGSNGESGTFRAIDSTNTSAIKCITLWNGTSNNSPPSGWEQPGFNDSAWGAVGLQSGSAIWQHSGAPLSSTEGNLFRQHFTIPAGITIVSATGTQQYNDACDGVYINGTLIAASVVGTEVFVTYSIDPSLFNIGGDNVLATFGRNTFQAVNPFDAFVSYNTDVTYTVSGTGGSGPTPTLVSVIDPTFQTVQSQLRNGRCYSAVSLYTGGTPQPPVPAGYQDTTFDEPAGVVASQHMWHKFRPSARARSWAWWT